MSLACRVQALFLVASIFGTPGCAANPKDWDSFVDSQNAYSIRYPSVWHLYTKQELTATAALTGSGGAVPTFAVQAANRSSFYVVVDQVAPLRADAAEGQCRDHLRQVYLSFCGIDLTQAGCIKLSERDTALAGQPAVEYVWRYPEMHGVVLINKHWCLSKGDRGFFLAATAAQADFDREDKEFFTPMARSLRLSGRSPEPKAAKAVVQTPERSEPGPKAQITFRSARDGNWEIYVMNVDGSAVRRLTKNSARDDMPRWSPDGKRIVFRSERDGNQEIYLMKADGSEQKRLTNEDAKDSEPCFSPDGSLVLFASKRTREWELYTMKLDGTDQKRVSRERLSASNGRFSPDGRQIVFCSGRDGDPEIYALRADGTNVRRLTRSPGYDGCAVWSPSGKRIAFASTRSGNFDIYVMAAHGSNPENVTSGGSNESGPAFIDENTLIFFSDRTGDVEIHTMNLLTGKVSRITNSPGYDGLPDVWVPGVRSHE